MVNSDDFDRDGIIGNNQHFTLITEYYSFSDTLDSDDDNDGVPGKIMFIF